MVGGSRIRSGGVCSGIRCRVIADGVVETKRVGGRSGSARRRGHGQLEFDTSLGNGGAYHIGDGASSSRSSRA